MVRNIIVSGGSSGIGFELIKYLLSNFKDANIIGLSRSISKIKELKKYSNFYFYDVDLTIESEVILTISKIYKKFEKIDFLINNAGAGIIKILEETTLEDWNNMIKINVTSAFLLTKEILKNRANNNFLHIINISSEAGLEPFPTYCAYGSAKFALTGFSKILKEEYRNKNVKVDIIYPGDVLTPFMQKCPLDKKLMEEYQIEVLDEKYMLKPLDIVKQVFYLMSLPKNVELGDIKIIPSGNFK